MDATSQRAHRRQTAGPLLPREEMLTALRERDRSYDGLFYAAVTTTGVFCRPSCPARDPKPEHVEFYATTREALVAGFRPCKRCRPLDAEAGTPEWAARLIARVEADPVGAHQRRGPARRGPGPRRRPPLVPQDARHDLPGLLPRPAARRRLRRAPLRRRDRRGRLRPRLGLALRLSHGLRQAGGGAARRSGGGARTARSSASPGWRPRSAPWSPARPTTPLCLLEYPDRRMMETPARHPPAAVRPAARPRRQPALRAAARAAGRVLRRPAARLRPPARVPREPLPAPRLGRPAAHPLRRDAHLRRARRRDRRAGRGARRGHRQRRQPHRHRHPLPPRDRRRRRPRRLRRRPLAQAAPARDRGRRACRGADRRRRPPRLRPARFPPIMRNHYAFC